MQKSDNFTGAVLMMVTMLSFVSNDALMKFAFQSISVEQGMFLRGAISVPLLGLLAYVRRGLFVSLDGASWRIIAVRSAAELFGTLAFLTALAHMPLANVTAILQSLPLTVTMFAAVFFGEQVGWRRWGAILIGFVGVLIIIRPGGEGFNLYTILALIAVASVTVRDAITRRLDRSVPSLFVAFVAAIPVWLYGGVTTFVNGWTPVSHEQLLAVAIAAIAITSGYLFAVMAMRIGEVSFVTPFRYTGMLWAILFGFVLFGVLPDKYTLIGTAIVIGMGIYTFHRERVRRHAPTSQAAGWVL